MSYQKKAEQFLKLHLNRNRKTGNTARFQFIKTLGGEAKYIAKSSFLRGTDYQNAMTAVWFSYSYPFANQTNMNDEREELLKKYFDHVKYPANHRVVVETAISNVIEKKNITTIVEEVVSDAVYSHFGNKDFLSSILLLKAEADRIASTQQSELQYLDYNRQLLLKTNYYTAYANEHYPIQKERNLRLLEERIHRLEDIRQKHDHAISNSQTVSGLSSKETEDLFKIAFRNYNQLISVADSKASLLINVNSIIVSVMLAFVLSKIEHNMVLLWPSSLLLTVCIITIFLSILASRPQKNIFSRRQNANSYQRFFFGSFDMIDPRFNHAGWDEYLDQLNQFFASSREKIYLEVYKETFNVRKVLARKFNYLAMAYLVFIIGLLISIIAFILSISKIA